MKKVYEGFTVNQIAEALNLSRGTVSKVINNRPGVSPKTRSLVEEYLRQPEVEDGPASSVRSQEPKTILFSYRLENIEYINGLLAGIDETLKKNGYMLAVNIVTGQSRPYLPASAYNGSIDGIISFNVYNYDYYEEVVSLPVPSVFLDRFYQRHPGTVQTDLVIPENKIPIREVILHLYRQGRKRFAFLGYPDYCLSLHQRWSAFRETLEELGLPFCEDLSILTDFNGFSQTDIYDAIKSRIEDMSVLPDAYICASDKEAIQLYLALKDLGIAIPDTIAVTGFDNVPESLRQTPPLSTVEAYSDIQGATAVKLILDHLDSPDRPPLVVQCQTRLLLRESTD